MANSELGQYWAELINYCVNLLGLPWEKYHDVKQKFIFSQICRLEIQTKVSSVGFTWILSLWLVDGHLLIVSSHDIPSMRVCVPISFYKDTNHIGLGLILILSPLCPDMVTF